MDESTFNKLLVDNLQLRIQVADLQKRLAEQQLNMLLQTLGNQQVQQVQQAQQSHDQEPLASAEEKVEAQVEPPSPVVEPPVVEPPVVSAPVVPTFPVRTKVLSQADLRVTKSAKP